MSTTETEYIEVINQCKSLFKNKLKDYGSAWRILRLQSLTDQIFIKAQRIRGLQTNKEQKIAEGQIEEFIGLINYSIIALIQIELGFVDEPDMKNSEALDSFEKHSKETYKLMLAKNHDYGEAWREMRVSSLTDLILQKLLRIKQIEENDGKTLVSEGVDANYQDIINYSVFAIIHLKEKNK
ncbi:MAG: hypothetical protein CMC79_03830 [Flavobacteriaceae bacterium]|nr:hypothetical protein [Flavobacteriaceae bacterium]|tara:strand:+ start:7169 stop:7714 length:546 start_codon:yes stop_codon:yes gene_type:complete